MATYTATFLSRDEYGMFARKHMRLAAVDEREVESYIRHGKRHGKWHVEGPITIRGPDGEQTVAA